MQSFDAEVQRQFFETGSEIMKKQTVVICTGLMVAFSVPVWAINKCAGLDGKVAFQDTPCVGKGEKIEVRPASGASFSTPATPPVLEDAPKRQSEADRLNALTATSQRGRFKIELEERQVPYAREAIAKQQTQCDAQLKTLQIKKLSANNNLAGATWEGSISSEMTAIATRCSTRSQELREEYLTLKKECVALGGCKGEF